MGPLIAPKADEQLFYGRMVTTLQGVSTVIVIAISFWRKTADVCCLKRRLILSIC